MYPDEVVQAAREEQPPAKVAQKPVLPRKKKPENDKKDIDNAAPSAYSDGVNIPQNLNETERAIVDQLLQGERLVDDVVSRTGLPTGKVLAALTLLEVRGIIATLPGRRVKLKQ